MKYEIAIIHKSIRRWLIFFIVALVISGLTALDVETGLWWLSGHVGNGVIQAWVSKVLAAVREVNLKYPFLFYGYDWLAFAHIVIAVAFIGPYKQPVRNKWVIQFGRIAALMIIPFAFIAGSIRGIPFWWQVIDCSFGIIALIPLSRCYWLIEKMEVLENKIKEDKSVSGKCQYQKIFQ